MLLALALLGFAAANASAATVYVKHDATGANNGSSWADAYTTLQPAITAATSGDEVWVATGTYKPTSYPNGGSTSRYMHFSLKNGVAVYGGFAGTETLLSERNISANPVILSGDIGFTGTASDNCYHVFYHPSGLSLDATAILDGVNVTAGYADKYDASPYNAGGGICNFFSSPTITNCTFRENHAYTGGGIFNSSSSPAITNCTFSNNTGYKGGAGIYNSASSPVVVCSTFNGNTADSGGGIYNSSSSSPTLTNCTFSKNAATYETGGGIYNSSSSSPTLINCTFSGNTAADIAVGAGDGIYNDGASSPIVKNCIFWGSATQIARGNPILTYCVVQGGFPGGTNIIQSDPQLGELADNGGLTMTCAISLDSSAVAIPETAGGNWNGCPATDQRGYARSASGSRAIGAYESGVGKPALRTATITNISGTGADSGGAFIEQGSGFTVSAKGLCWGIEENPTLADSHVECGLGIASFSGSLAGLIPNVTYHVRAYAQLNDASTVFGQDILFQTPKAPRRAYVVPGGAGTMDGSSWANAYADPQIAIMYATEVWIVAGTYKPTSWPNGGFDDREKHFSLSNETVVYGGFVGSETLLTERNISANPTILSGDIGILGDNSDNCYHVFYHPDGLALDATAVLDGVTITGGNADGEDWPHIYGGGMFNESCSPMITGCTFVDNKTSFSGGGISNTDYAPGGFSTSPIIINCTFTNNEAVYGSGMHNDASSPSIINCTFSYNSGNGSDLNAFGGAPSITNCTFYKCGGISVYTTEAAAIKNSIFWGNSVNIYGDNLTVSYCIIEGGFPEGTNIITDDPQLGELADNGGPTMTCAIPIDSSAMAIPKTAGGNWNGCPSTDQRGYARPTSGFRAIGAYQPGVGKPVLRTEQITDNSGTSANSGGSFDEGSGYTVVAKGLCWGTGEKPTLADSHVECGSGFTSFSGVLSGLVSGVVYHVRAYAQLNDGSFVFGQDIRFIAYCIAYVIPGGAGTMDGSSWANAYADPQIAIENAQEVWVAAGTYLPQSWPSGGGEDREKHFSLRSGVVVYGGFAGNETQLAERDIAANPSIFSGDIGIPGDDSDNCFRVFCHTAWQLTDAVLDGVVVSKSTANYPDANSDSGGIYNRFSSPSIVNCIFTENSSCGINNSSALPTITNCTFSNNGVGICNTSSSPAITNCTFSDNNSGIYNELSSPAITNCMFSNNHAYNGGGIYNWGASPAILNCTFNGNTATSYSTAHGALGGAIYNDSSYALSSPTIIDCTFIGNSAKYGGGIYDTAYSTITNCTFKENFASNGGGIYNRGALPSITNCTFQGNIATDHGGGMYNHASSPAIANCTFTENIAGGIVSAAPSYFPYFPLVSESLPTIKNCIFWENSQCQVGSSYLAMSYCVIQDEIHEAGTNIISDDPLLGVLADNGGPALTCAIPLNSSAMAIPKIAGGNWNGCPDTDQRGLARPTSGLRAIGAYQPGVGRPVLRTEPVTDILSSNANSGGAFTGDVSGFTVVVKGLCWGTNEFPTLADSHVECGAGFDAYSGALSTLVSGVVYHVRAYAQLNDSSFIFGQDIRFMAHRVAYVVPGGAGTMDGSSWADAYADPQVAIENASEVWIAAGAYKPSSWPNGGSSEREKHFSLSNGVAVYGGFAGAETLLSERNISAHPTILSGDIGIVGTTADNCYHVFYHPSGLSLDATAILDGFTITDGNATGSSPHNYGAGMYNSASSPSITNCTFSGNTASSSGGGIYCTTSASPSIDNCTFIGNAAGSGGGIQNTMSSLPTITYCTFSGNTVGINGGGINNVFSSPSIINCTFTDNSASSSSGGIYNFTSSPIVKNCIFWENTPNQLTGGTPTVSYCVIQGGFTAGTDIVVDDPQLGVLADNGGPSMTRAISTNSPAIAIPEAAGGNWNECPDTDQRGYVRPSSGFRAIGAYQPGVGKPALRTNSVTGIAGTSANSGGFFVDEGSGFSAITKGLCWGSNENPTVADSHVECGSGFSAFVGTLTGLALGSIYHVRSYAQLNDGSLAYGQDISFKTPRKAKAYVVPGGAGTMDGSSWANAYADPQVGIDFATEVWVAVGTYVPMSFPNGGSSSRYMHFSLANGVTVYGGFAGTEALLTERNISANPTILSGNIGSSVNSSDNCYHVLYHPSGLSLNSTAVLDGFTISHGKANGSDPHRYGGGIYNYSSSPKIVNCSIIDNSSTSGGSGIYNYSSSPQITNCTIRGNSGGGIFNSSSSSPQITNCTFSGNTATTYGGGINNSSSSPTITNCTFYNNTAVTSGGGIYNSASSPSVKNSIFWENSPNQIAGGTPTVSYCVVQGGFAGGTSIITDDPLLGLLADNGGATLTCAIPVDSSAMVIPESAGGNWNNCPAIDQRGVARPVSGFRAIGAYEPGVGKPALRTTPITDNMMPNASSGGVFIDEGSGFTVVAKGLCWGTNTNPTLADSSVACGAGFDSFSGVMSGLVFGVANHVRAYAQLDDGSTVFGQDVSFSPYGHAYVVPGGAGTMDGYSWANAYADPQVAIDHANEVWIAAGSYCPTSWPNGGSDAREKHFALKNGVAVYGGFTGIETSLDERDVAANRTILSGDIGDLDDPSDNCYHVFYHPNGLNSSAILDGFTITDGSPDDCSPDLEDWRGGGMYNKNGASPSVNNCTFSDNSNGAMSNYNSSPSVSNCTFIGNNSNYAGVSGGMANVSSSPTIINCTFIGNTSTRGWGGAMDNVSSSPVITNCTFSNNTAYYGGALRNIDSSPTITNCTFSGNSAEEGDAICNDYGFHGSFPAIKNSIFWGSANPINDIEDGTLDYCIVQGGFAEGTNIITDDPRLGPLADNGGSTKTCAVPPDSPAVAIPESAGGNWNGCPDTDQRGYDRPTTGFRAIGAFQPGAGKPVLQTTQVSDNSGFSASSGGSFIDEGSGFSVVTKGLCWGTGESPTVDDAQVECGSGFEPFSGTISGSGIVPGAIAYVRAYAELDDGSYRYGQDIGFMGYRRAYVVPGGSGCMDGSTWEDAYADPQAAIENATEIWIAAGTYLPTSWPNGGSAEREKHFSLRDGVTVYGGFAGTETRLNERNIAANPVVLSGDIGVLGDPADNCYHVFYHPFGKFLGPNATLDGVTVTGGNANDVDPHDCGAGMNNRFSSPTITNCTFSGNAALSRGGGIYGSSSSSTITNCTFSGNTADSGGGIDIYSASSPTIVNCTFSGNAAVTDGGGINAYSTSSPTVVNCTFSGNSAANGRAICALSADSIVKNSILWGGTGQVGGIPALSSCVVKGGYAGGTNIVTKDPRLKPLADNGGPTMTCAIPRTSPAVAIPKTAGGNWNGCPDTDQRGRPRVTGGNRAMGAYEPDAYVLTYLAGEYGLIDGISPQVVESGADGSPVTAVPDVGYHFAGWSDASVDNPRQDVSVGGDLTVTANFAINQYTVSFQTDGTAGATLSGETVQAVPHGSDCTAVTANAPGGYFFVGWSGGYLGFYNPLTLTNVTASMVVIANFALAADTASLTMAPASNGATSPIDTVKVRKGRPATIRATASGGHQFIHWEASAAGTIDRPQFANAAVTLSGDTTVTAIFAEEAVVARLTVRPGNFGSVIPEGSFWVLKGESQAISATPDLGASFLGWDGTAGAAIADAAALTTTVSLSQDATVTAFFQVEQVAVGSVFAVDAGDVGLAVFNAKPKVYAEYTHPVTGKAGKATAKVLDKIDTLAGNATLACEWTKKIRLYEAKAFKASEAEGIGAAGWVTANQQDLLMDLRMDSKEIEDQSVQALALAVPVIVAIEAGDPDPKTGADTLVITGTWFGTKRPKVWREYTVPGKDVGTEIVKRQTMKVLKPTEADALLGFKDSQGKPAFMNPATGASKAVVVVPAKEPRGVRNGIIVLENGVGLATGNAP
jgi:parallel beta-helix repeat protein